MKTPSDAAILRALENYKKWGRTALPEEENDPDYELVHDWYLFHHGFIEEDRSKPLLTTCNGEVEAPFKLSVAGIAWMKEQKELKEKQ